MAADFRESILVAARSAALAATTAATLALLGLADFQRTAVEVLAVERLGGAGGIGARHFHETEATRAAGIAVVDQSDLFNGSMGCEEGANRIFGGREGKISNV